MKTAGVLLFTAAAVGAVSWVLVETGSWLACAAICACVLAGLMMAEKNEL